MKYLLPFLVLCTAISDRLTAQSSAFYHLEKDSGFILTEKGASFLASLPLKCIIQEYPNKTGHVVQGDSDQAASAPRTLHPVFYGCFDWHSSVHGHWMLVKLLKQFPQLPEGQRIRDIINTAFSASNIQAELKYFNTPMAKSWERTYGWAWLLKLDEELYSWEDADAQRWHLALQPLTQKIMTLWMEFLPKQTYPNRSGVHPNTAFGLVFALEYARALHLTGFEKMITGASQRLFGNDKNAPAVWEPDGSDFLSPALSEADLMRRVLAPAAFIRWLNAYISPRSLQHLTQLPVVSDRTDLQIVHLDGLCFSRSWCMRSIAAALPSSDPRKKLLNASAMQHLRAVLPHIVSGNYGGEHWLASFAVLSLLH